MNHLYARTVRAAVAGMAVFAVLIFVPAGTVRYWQGWAYLATFSVTSTLMTVYLAVHDRELLERRLHGGPSAETTPTQKVIMTFASAAFVGSIVVPVLDHRFGWSPPVPVSVSLVGDALIALTFLLLFFVLRENRFGGSTVTVAEDQTVVSTGPYALVRHPMYAGTLPLLIGTPLALGSWWGLLMAPLFVAVLVWRSLDEERFLCENLAGYAEYTHDVRYRMVPHVW